MSPQGSRRKRQGTPVNLELSSDESDFIRSVCGAVIYLVHPSDDLARAFRFLSPTEMHEFAEEYADVKPGTLRIDDDTAIRLLALCEVIPASEVLGAFFDWEPHSGFTEVETFEIIRGLRRKILGRLAGH